jgi:pimeloyl-ACP methyl ester carboxylesterase
VTDLFFTDSGGELPALVLIHGGLANHRSILLWAAPLAARFRLVVPDLRGSGRSHFAGELTWDQLADDIAVLARSLGIARATVGGISFGSGVAVATALRHAALVERLVLLHPVYGGADVGLTPDQATAMAAMDAAGRRAPAEGPSVLFALLERLPAELRERARATLATYDPASIAATTRFLASGAQPFASARELAAIACPVVVVPGVDPQHPVAIAELYRAHLPACTWLETADFAQAI